MGIGMHQEQLEQLNPARSGRGRGIHLGIVQEFGGIKNVTHRADKKVCRRYATDTVVISTDVGLGQALQCMQTEGVDRPVNPMRW